MPLDVTNPNLLLISKLFATLGTSQSQRVSYIGEERCVTTLKTAGKVTKVGYMIRVFFSVGPDYQPDQLIPKWYVR